MCGHGLELTRDANTGKHVCTAPKLPHCAHQSENRMGWCDKCDEGFVWDGKACSHCGLQGCSMCVRFDVAEPYNDCLKCEDGFSLILTFRDDWQTIPQHICEY